jgi:hypothetical protein
VPVLVTIATINVLFRASENDVSFLDPAALRARVSDVIEDTDTRERVLQIIDELQELAHKYNDKVAATIDLYLAKSVAWDSSATGLIELLEPLDGDRVLALRGIVQARQSIHELLTAEQWKQVFN